MTNVADHYRSHLAPVYVWMCGGFEAALERGEAEIAALFPDLVANCLAVDLGAGFGMHSIPLARRGYAVLSLDSSAHLLDRLKKHSGGLPITAIEADLALFERYLDRPAEVVLCMGDTLPHLPDRAAVSQLFSGVADGLGPRGRFVATFRDYTRALAGTARFIPVRSDEERILTCFLEYAADHVDVTDMLHQRRGSTWQLTVSTYRKLRLDPQWVVDSLRALGFSAHLESAPSGMVRVIAAKGEHARRIG